MPTNDLRTILNPLAAVLAARPKWRTVAAQTYQPTGTQADPDPAPVTVPARTEVYTDPADLPAAVLQGGMVDLVAQVAMLQAAVAQWQDLEIRTVAGTQTFAPTLTLTWAAGSKRDIVVPWSSTPLADVRGAIARIEVGPAMQGRLSARVVPGSVNSAGCTVEVAVVGALAVVITSVLPVSVHAEGIYLYWPPYQP